MHLTIGNKLYSSWSMRPWLVLRAFDIPFEETVISLSDADFKARVTAISPAGKVPVLVDGETVVWETLAIIEYLADRYPEHAIWPRDARARAHARSVANEMHAGFTALRGACPMNLGKSFARRDRGEPVDRDVARITALWAEARGWFGAAAGGPFLYGAFTAADAMYAPVVARFAGYDVALDQAAQAYAAAVQAHPAYVAWREAGLAEPWVVAEDEVDEPCLVDFRAKP